MGVFDKLERGLERAVKQPFARVFKAEVQPVEIASAMRKELALLSCLVSGLATEGVGDLTAA